MEDLVGDEEPVAAVAGHFMEESLTHPEIDGIGDLLEWLAAGFGVGGDGDDGAAEDGIEQGGGGGGDSLGFLDLEAAGLVEVEDFIGIAKGGDGGLADSGEKIFEPLAPRSLPADGEQVPVVC